MIEEALAAAKVKQQVSYMQIVRIRTEVSLSPITFRPKQFVFRTIRNWSDSTCRQRTWSLSCRPWPSCAIAVFRVPDNVASSSPRVLFVISSLLNAFIDYCLFCLLPRFYFLWVSLLKILTQSWKYGELLLPSCEIAHPVVVYESLLRCCWLLYWINHTLSTSIAFNTAYLEGVWGLGDQTSRILSVQTGKKVTINWSD